MNLKSRMVRLPIAALGACALVTGGGVLTAGSAFAAPTALALNSGGDAFTIANLGHGSVQAAATEYAQKLTGADADVKLDLITAPFGGQLFYDKVTSPGAASTAPSTVNFKSDEVQTVTKSGTPTGGTFTLTYNGQTTAGIAYDASGAAVQAALEALSNIDVGDVTVTGVGTANTVYTVTFGGALADTDVPALTFSTAGLTGGTPAIVVATTTAGGADTSISSAITTPASTDYLYIGANVPGTYTYRYFQDSNSNGQLDADDERASAVVTTTVVDATGATTTTSDDVAPTITSTSPISVGQAVTATIGYTKSLTLVDARGSSVSPSLKSSLAARTFVDVSSEDDAAGVGTVSGIANATDTAATYTAASNTTSFAVGTPTEAGAISIKADLKAAGGGADNTTSGNKTVTVESNNVTTVASAVTLVDGKVVAPTTSTATVKSGTAAVTYTAKAVNTTPTPNVVVAGATVYFTLGGAGVANLTTSGTTVDAANHIFSAVTNADGIASLTVTSSVTTDGTTYTVSPTTNSATVTPPTITTTYADAAAASIDNINTVAELTPEVTSPSVILKGKLLDQFGAAFQPASSASQQVVVQIPDGSTSGNAVITNGAFTYTYTPSPAPTAGDSTTFDFTYGSLSDGATEGGTIRYASTVAAATVTISAPANAATGVDLEDSQNPPSGIAVTGTVSDAANAGLAFKTVTLTGSDGVYFADQANANAAHPLSTTFTAVTNNSGAIQGAYVFFTKSGTATLTAKSGTATKTVTVTTDDSVDSYKVIAIDAKGKPGSTLAVTGKVTDLFGNPVVGRHVILSLSDLSVGALAASNVTTDSNGVWSTTILPASNQSGEVTLTVKLRNALDNATLTANPTADGGYKLAGLTVGDGEYTDQAKITVGVTALTLSSSAKLTYGSKYYARGALLSGTGADANADVDIYAKVPGGTYALIDTVKADESGAFGVAEKISKSTYFLAKSGGASSSASPTRIYSGVVLTAKSNSRGHVTLSANGGPNATAYLYFYRVFASGDTDYLGKKMSSTSGNGSATFSAPKGNRKYKVLFQSPGTTTGSDTVSVKVK